MSSSLLEPIIVGASGVESHRGNLSGYVMGEGNARVDRSDIEDDQDLKVTTITTTAQFSGSNQHMLVQVDGFQGTSVGDEPFHVQVESAVQGASTAKRISTLSDNTEESQYTNEVIEERFTLPEPRVVIVDTADNGDTFYINPNEISGLSKALIEASETPGPTLPTTTVIPISSPSPLTQSTSNIQINIASVQEVVVKCPICFDDVTPTSAQKGKPSIKVPCPSDHHYCTDCLTKHIQVKISDTKLVAHPIQCPECKWEFDEVTVSKLESSTLQEAFRKHLRLLNHSAFRCPNPKCYSIVDTPVDETLTQTQCPMCRVDMCYQCKSPWHKGFTCNENMRPDEAVNSLVETASWVRCPACGIIVEKIDGCSHMTCRCGGHFCYWCGYSWNGLCLRPGGCRRPTAQEREQDLEAQRQQQQPQAEGAETTEPPQPTPMLFRWETYHAEPLHQSIFRKIIRFLFGWIRIRRRRRRI